jgi:asparagine synthase (glutamine-hydrolysing)
MLYSDKFGLKNVYYYNMEPNSVITNHKIFFIEDLKDNIVSNGFNDYCKKGISSYFTFRYPIINLTMFDGIERLDSGTAILENKIYTYWHPNFITRNVSEPQAISDVKGLLVNSIKNLVQNKQIIGITLSGGLDSSLIVAMCRKLYPRRKIYTYSCGFYGDDEFEYSRKVAELFSDKHEEIVLGKEDFIGSKSIIPSLIKHKCAPLHPNETALAYAEMKAKKDLCDIVLCGEGADDIFGGYGHNFRMFMTYNGEPSGFYDYIINNYRYFTAEERSNLLQPQFDMDIETEFNVLAESTAPYKEENKMFYFIQRLHTRGLIERGYNALSYNNFEGGFPFIDDELVEYANSLPFDMKVRWKEGKKPEDIKGMSYIDISEKYDITKYILKKVAEEYLPEDIIYRKKVGFPVPFELWFQNDTNWDLDEHVFRTKDISNLSGWKKFMVINLDTFIKIFNVYKL